MCSELVNGTTGTLEVPGCRGESEASSRFHEVFCMRQTVRLYELVLKDLKASGSLPSPRAGHLVAFCASKSPNGKAELTSKLISE